MPGNATGDALSPGTPFTPQQTHRTPSQSQSALHSRLQTQPQPQAQGSSGQGRDLGAATEAEIGECFDAFLRDSESGEEEDGARGWGRGQGQGEHTQGVLERLTAAGAFDGSRSGAENAFARYSASVVDALPKRGGGGAGGGGGGSSGVVDEQLLRKRALHSRFLRFLRHTQCWGHLLQTQPQAAQVVLEHGEQLAALVYLRTAQSSATQQGPTLSRTNTPRAVAVPDPLSSPFASAGKSPGPGTSSSSGSGASCARRVLWELMKSAAHTLQAPPGVAATPRPLSSPFTNTPGLTTPSPYPAPASASASLYTPTPAPGRGAGYTPGYSGIALGLGQAPGGDPGALFFSRASAAVQALFAAAQRCAPGLLVRSAAAVEGAEGGAGVEMAASGAPTLALGAGERLEAALEVCGILLGSLEAAAEEREEKAEWYPEYASSAAAAAAQPGAEAVAGAPLAPWWTAPSVRVGLAALTAVIDSLKREVSASAAGPLLSACFPAQERVAGVLLDAFARVLDAQRGAALLGVPEAHPGLAGEYEGTRRALIDRLMGEALEGAGSEEEALQRLSWPVALAKRHAAYSSLFDLCWLRLQNRGMLLSLMMELSETHHRDRFTRYVFSRLLHAQQLQALVHLGPQFPLELREFLTDVPSLQWLHQIAVGDASGAAATLLSLSLSRPSSDSLPASEASLGTGTAAGARGGREPPRSTRGGTYSTAPDTSRNGVHEGGEEEGGESSHVEQAEAEANAAVTAAVVKRVVGDTTHGSGAVLLSQGSSGASLDSSSRTLVARRRMLQLSKISALAARDKEAAAEAGTELRLLAIQREFWLVPVPLVPAFPVLVAPQESVVGKGEPMLVGPYALPPLELIRSLVDLSDTPPSSFETVQSSLLGARLGAAVGAVAGEGAGLGLGGALKGPKALRKAFDALAIAGPDRLLRSAPEDATSAHEELMGVLARVWQRAVLADDWAELGEQMREQGWGGEQYISAVQRTALFYGASKLYKPQQEYPGLSDLPASSRTFEGVFPIFGGAQLSDQGSNGMAESVEQVLQASPAFHVAGDMMLDSMQLACGQHPGARVTSVLMEA